ncbi:MAG TPA: DnaJ domain-containing protein [Spirochaetota bacterium]|nr:DnaJ domain-containing protein [Spirochaetota bacterium]HOM38089.1 DnaJ domain-containing protein [Spirochaetota bacterium]HPQ48891.1 DnaJ domain-containing protein [Spirochaetota bacterium]
MVDYFKILNIEYTEDENLIKKAFYKRVKELHPDTGQYDSSEFNLLIEAYKTLSDKKKRDEYIRTVIKEKTKNNLKKIEKNRIIFPNNLGNIVKKVKIFDRKRYKDAKKDFNVDLYVLISKKEINYNFYLEIDLPARIICPKCFGNNIYCDLCSGIKSIIRSFKYKVILKPPFKNMGKIEIPINKKIKGGEFLVKKIEIGILLF